MRHEYSNEKCTCGHIRMDHDQNGDECRDCACLGFESAETEEMQP